MILAKAIDIEQIKIKEDIGCDGIELQLTQDFIKMDIPEILEFTNGLLDHNIRSVHTPFNEACLLEWLCLGPNPKLLDRIFFVANTIGGHNGNTVNIVCHTNLNMHNYDCGNVIGQIAERLSQLLVQYPNTTICIENVIPVDLDRTTQNVYVTNNGFDDPVILCTRLRELIKSDRIGLVLDTSHALSTVRTLDNYCAYCGLPRHNIALSSFCELYVPYLKLIHFSRTIADGIQKSKHGQPFTAGMYEEAKNLLNCIGRYIDLYNIDLVLEVAEKDYSICDGYRETKKLVDKYLAEKESIAC